MLDLKLPWKKVKVGGPINFTQWQMSEQVRGVHLAVDKEGDMIAVPVVVVDPTQPTSSVANFVMDEVADAGAVAAIPASTTGDLVVTLPEGYQYELNIITGSEYGWVDALDTMALSLFSQLPSAQPWQLLLTVEAQPQLLYATSAVKVQQYTNQLRFTARYPVQVQLHYVTSAGVGFRQFRLGVQGRRRSI